MDLGDTGWGHGVGSVGSGSRAVVGSCEHSDEPVGSGATELVNIPKKETCFSCNYVTHAVS
jgi:hypothetical protein